MKQTFTIYHIIIAITIGYVICQCFLQDEHEGFKAYDAEKNEGTTRKPV